MATHDDVWQRMTTHGNPWRRMAKLMRQRVSHQLKLALHMVDGVNRFECRLRAVPDSWAAVRKALESMTGLVERYEEGEVAITVTGAGVGRQLRQFLVVQNFV